LPISYADAQPLLATRPVSAESNGCASAPVITKIPVLPISYADAQPLLSALTGRVAPADWRGGLGIAYHVGPGPAKVHLRVTSNWEPLKTLYDVVGKIPGSTFPDEWVIRGNHHD